MSVEEFRVLSDKIADKIGVKFDEKRWTTFTFLREAAVAYRGKIS